MNASEKNGLVERAGIKLWADPPRDGEGDHAKHGGGGGVRYTSPPPSACGCHLPVPGRSYGLYPFSAAPPAKRAVSPTSSSIRSSWLSFAMRSGRDRLPVLIWPQLSATARSAIV